MSSISKFYSGRSVFITGGSGFIGKQVIEKLLRSCSDIERIYVLMRAKKGLTPQQRLQRTVEAPLFERLRQRSPDFCRKLVPVVGDVAEDHLGISDADRQKLESNVSVVIHSAATLNFMEPLRDAVNMNVLGVKRMLTLCKQLPSLDALVHVSTGYSQVDKKVINERIYDPPVSPDRLIQMTSSMTNEELAVLTPYLLKKHNRPNTYTFTKSVAEKLIEQEIGNIPCAIVRPTIVGASWTEPIPGLIDNYTGFTGMLAGTGTGFLRALLTGRNVHIDIVPVDMVANLIVSAGWGAGASSTDESLNVFHITTATERFLLMKDLVYLCEINENRHPIPTLPGRCSIHVTESKLVHRYYSYVVSPLRCAVIDAMLLLKNKKPRMMKFLQRSHNLQDVLEYFMTNNWQWTTDKTRQLYDSMNELDRQKFNFDVKELEWDEYIERYWLGVKKYLLKIDDAPQPPASHTDDRAARASVARPSLDAQLSSATRV